MAKGPGLNLGWNTGWNMNMEHRLTPPIANTADEVVPRTHLVKKSIDGKLLSEVESYIKSEDFLKPYADAQIMDYLSSVGYNVSRTDIASARKMLGIKASSIRHRKTD
jgi:DNA-directed RNA polymerase specialized sigma54-like protein